MDMLSVIFLLGVVAVGFISKCNIGILAIGSSLVLGTIGGISNSAILNGFDAKMFITLVGVSFLFSMAQENGTLELVAKKAVALAGKRTYLVPFIIFLVSGILTALGPGNIPVGNLMTVVAVTIAVNMDENPLLFALAAKVASNGFTLSPLAPAGVLAQGLGENLGFDGFIMTVMWNCIMWSCVLMIGFCIYYKVWTIKPSESDELDENLRTEKLNKNQWLTIGGIGVMVVLVVAFGMEVGLASFFIAAILAITKIADEKGSLKKVPWGTLILICGVGVLMNVVDLMGGIALISDTLLSVMTPETAAPIMAVTCSMLSFFSSTTGVVMPSMIPTLGPIVETLGTGTAGFAELTSVVVTSSLSAAFSPASTGGGLILAAYMTASSSPHKEEEQNKLFAQLLVIATACVIGNVLLSWGGFYSLLPLIG